MGEGPRHHLQVVILQTSQQPRPVAEPWRAIKAQALVGDRIEHLLGEVDFDLLGGLEKWVNE